MKAQKTFLPFTKGLVLLCTNGRIGCNVLTGLWEFQQLSPPEVINGFFPATTEFAARPAAHRHQRATASHRSSRENRAGKRKPKAAEGPRWVPQPARRCRARRRRTERPEAARDAPRHPSTGRAARAAPHNFSGSGGALKQSSNRAPPADWSRGFRSRRRSRPPRPLPPAALRRHAAAPGLACGLRSFPLLSPLPPFPSPRLGAARRSRQLPTPAAGRAAPPRPRPARGEVRRG